MPSKKRRIPKKKIAELKREVFGDWGKSLTEWDFWRAVAILGARQGEGVDLASIQAADRHLPWALPDPLSLSISADRCLKVWQELAVSGWPRLALRRFYENQAEVNQKFLNHAATSLYLNVDFQSPGLSWHWPLRVGFLTDPVSLAMYASVLEERAQHETLRTLTEVSTARENNVFDLLILPTRIQDAQDFLFRSPKTVHAHCLVVISDWENAFEPVGQLVRFTNSSGVFLRPGAFSPRDWFRNFVWSLSHDLPMDEADRQGVLFANADLIEQARISSFMHKVTDRLRRAGERRIVIPESLALELELPAGLSTSSRVGEELQARMESDPRLIFDRESRGGSWSVLLQRTVGAIRQEELIGGTRRAAKLDIAFEAAPRFLQATTGILQPNLTTTIGIFIGADEEGAVVADSVFPEVFSDQEEGHLLTVVFSEPRLLSKPLVETVYLPRTGRSNDAFFVIATGADFKFLEARVSVLYQNRILQTALLRASSGERATLKVEMNVRPGMSGFDQQRSYDESLILNHTENGESRATLGAGYNFATFSMQGLDKTIELIEGRINGTPWADDGYKTLDASDSYELLRFLARQGAALYREFLRYSPDPDRLRDATHIQIVAREHASRLPIEFFYSRIPPRDKATLCSNWRRALETGSCTCEDSDSTICPLGFWCLSRVIEWHRFDIKSANETEGRAFALRDARPGARESALPLLSSAVMGASARADKVVSDSVESVRDKLKKSFGAQFAAASDWTDWAQQVQLHSPSVLFLIPHTDEDKDQIPTMEISNDTLASENIRRDHVIGPASSPPVVLLFGCNTDNAGLPHESFVSYFSDNQAAIVVSSISKVLGRHAAPLAQKLLDLLLAVPRKGDRSFGEVLRDLRRQSLLEGPPVALVLKAYGDADWRI